MVNKWIIVTFMGLLLMHNAFGQITLNSEMATFFNDNLYRAPQKTSDFVTNLNFNLMYQLEKIPLSITVNPDYYFYVDHPEQNFWFAGGGLEYYPFLDEKQSWQFYTAAYYFKRLNKTDFKSYNYDQWQLSAALYFNGQQTISQFSYQFRKREYENFSSLNNNTHYFNWKLNRAFKTRTTVIAHCGFALRHYNAQTTYIFVTDTLPSSGGGRHGSGKGQKDHSPRVVTNEVAITADPLQLAQLTLSLRLAQNLRPNMGWYIQYLKSFDLSGAGTFQNFGSYLGDEELFDDPLSYVSNEWRSQLTWILGKQWQLKLGGGFNRKSYIKEHAYLTATDSLPSGTLRKDEKISGYLKLKKTLFIKDLLTFTITAQLFYTDNQSNSYWYNYQNLVTGLSLTLMY